MDSITKLNSSQQEKKIGEGVFLQKILEKRGNNENNANQDLYYIFSVRSEKLGIIEFTADFTGSINVQLENRQGGLIATTLIDPYQQQIVAISSIYGKVNQNSYHDLPYQIKWQRPVQFMNSEEEDQEIDIFYEDIEPVDVLIGDIDSINFYSAIACLAERPALIERIFITKNFNEQGVYRVRLCINGQWQVVTIDDYFPCYPNDAGPVFGKNHGNELWFLILEKAFAKCYKSYLNLQNLTSKDTFYALTGCPCQFYQFSEIEQDIENGNFWQILKENEEEGYLITCYQNQMMELSENQQKKKFVQDPWGNFEWQGKWSYQSEAWDQDFISNLDPVLDGSDASFWIQFEDFLNEFQGINVIKIHNWNEIRLNGRFLRCQQEENDSNIETVQSKYYYQFEVYKDTKFNLGLVQEDENIDGNKYLKNQIDLGFCLWKKNENKELDNILLVLPEYKQQIEQEIMLEPGIYIFLPITVGCGLKKQNKKQEEEQNILCENLNDIRKLTPLADDQEIQVSVKDALETDLNVRAKILEVSNFGQEVKIEPEGVKLFYSQNKKIQSYTYAAINQTKDLAQINLDYSCSIGYNYSTKLGKISKKIQPEQIEIISQVQAIQNYDREKLDHVLECDWLQLE
ncbi:hypothetical protein PPERSA_10868 [Pseudocohnilembus persalinus]|uniref:Calpain catalytic domain-containing protein n=1 Tax=Pseudocohnilembus persalinus TaxID=266149 RepID=A0A0V0QDV7_PSEPJ|nr:hypothetical protein PPERSA_10868 [Pseudocohnilembus persalinus]|eukprot:KRX00369.1 hypothetical protein PPERSA_10868 [Pseudocohnilembus persalinus]